MEFLLFYRDTSINLPIIKRKSKLMGMTRRSINIQRTADIEKEAAVQENFHVADPMLSIIVHDHFYEEKK